MASIRTRTRKDGSSYTAVLYVHNGKQSSSSFNDYTEALKFQEVCNRLGTGEALKVWKTTAPRNGHTVESYINEHLNTFSGVEKKTVTEYRRYLTRDIEPVLGHIPLSTLSRTDISKRVNKLRADGASGKTIQNKLGFLSGSLNLAVQGGRNPCQPGCRSPASS